MTSVSPMQAAQSVDPRCDGRVEDLRQLLAHRVGVVALDEAKPTPLDAPPQPAIAVEARDALDELLRVCADERLLSVRHLQLIGEELGDDTRHSMRHRL